MRFECEKFTLEMADDMSLERFVQAAQNLLLFKPSDVKEASGPLIGDKNSCGCIYQAVIGWHNPNWDWVHGLINTVIDAARVEVVSGTGVYPNNREIAELAKTRLQQIAKEIQKLREFFKTYGAFVDINGAEQKSNCIVFTNTYQGDVACLLTALHNLAGLYNENRELRETITQLNLTLEEARSKKRPTARFKKKKRASARRKTAL